MSNNINKTIGEETSVKADVKKETHDSEIPKEGQNQDDDMNLENGSDESTSGSESKFDKTSPVSKKSELKKQNKRQKKEEKQKEKVIFLISNNIGVNIYIKTRALSALAHQGPTSPVLFLSTM